VKNVRIADGIKFLFVFEGEGAKKIDDRLPTTLFMEDVRWEAVVQ
jgi:hypothetical protein